MQKLAGVGLVVGALCAMPGTCAGPPGAPGPAARYLHIQNAGQSNGFGSSPAVTQTQEYDSLMRRTGSAVFQTAVGTGREAPMYGAMGAARQLLASEQSQGRPPADVQFVASDSAVSAMAIDQLSKGGSTRAYENGIAQLAAGQAIANVIGASFASGAVLWTQGEADAGPDGDAYKAKLIAYAENWNRDARSVTGQTEDSPLITWQVGSNYRKSTAVAQWRAGLESSLVYLACPSYQFDYRDFQHLSSESIRWLGGYYGMVIKKVVLDRSGWQPLQPVAVQVTGNSIDITFNKDRLALDTALMPEQPDYGFSVVNGAGATQAIKGVALMGGNRVRLTMESAPASGWRVRYGHNTVTGKLPYRGGGGNLRDTQDWTYAGHPMHNWSVIFDWPIQAG